MDCNRSRGPTTVLMDHNSPTSNSFEKCSKVFFVSLFTVYLSLLPFYVKLEQLIIIIIIIIIINTPYKRLNMDHVFPIWITFFLKSTRMTPPQNFRNKKLALI